MDIITQRHLNRHTKEVDTLFVIHFQQKDSFNRTIQWLESNHFHDIARRALLTESNNYFEDGISCVLYENQISNLIIHFFGKELSY